MVNRSMPNLVQNTGSKFFTYSTNIKAITYNLSFLNSESWKQLHFKRKATEGSHRSSI